MINQMVQLHQFFTILSSISALKLSSRENSPSVYKLVITGYRLMDMEILACVIHELLRQLC